MTAGIALGAVPRGKPVLDRDDWTVRVLLVLLAAFFLVALAIPLWMMISRGFLDSEGRFIGLANYALYFGTPALSQSRARCRAGSQRRPVRNVVQLSVGLYRPWTCLSHRGNGMFRGCAEAGQELRSYHPTAPETPCAVDEDPLPARRDPIRLDKATGRSQYLPAPIGAFRRASTLVGPPMQRSIHADDTTAATAATGERECPRPSTRQ